MKRNKSPATPTSEHKDTPHSSNAHSNRNRENAPCPSNAHTHDTNAPESAPARTLRLKVGDVVLFALSLAVTAAAFVLCYKPSTTDSLLVIADSPHGTWVYSLKADTHAAIHGAIGDTHLCIKDGTAYVSESVCSNKTCVMAGTISQNGEWIACMPNQVFIRIQGEEPTEHTTAPPTPTLDAIAQ